MKQSGRAGRAGRRLAPSLYLSLAVMACMLSACAQGSIQAAERQDGGDCDAAFAGFKDAAGYFMTADRAGLLPADYQTVLGRIAGDPARAGRIAADMRGDAAALDRLTAGYDRLQSCRAAHADAWRKALAEGRLTPGAAKDQMTTEATIYRAELAEAQLAAQHAADLGAIYGQAAEALLTSHGVAQPAQRPYRALESTPIHPAPQAASAAFAVLRKGQRVLAPDAAADGWVAIDLDDGSLGYVEAAALKPLTPNPCAQNSAAAGAALPQDPYAALDVLARRTVPQKQAALAALIDTASATADRGFSLPAGGAAAVANAAP